jgi:ribosomal protein S18 acetylase RimI-like enzyme
MAKQIPSISSRLYETKDLPAMIDLLAVARPAAWIAEYPTSADLHELLSLPDTQAKTRLWFDANGLLAGFALVDPWNNLLFEILPQGEAVDEIASQMVAWGKACVERNTPKSGDPATLDASCRQDDLQRIALLEQNGFHRLEIRSLHLTRPLDEPIPAPELPPGFIIRPLAGASEMEALVALHRAAFGSEQMTLELRRAIMEAPEYIPELDLVVVAPDGRLAGYCTCQISPDEDARSGRSKGYTDPVAVHPDFQRRGLARALLLTGMRLLKERGLQAAVMGTSSENHAMQKVAEAVGFQVHSARLWYSQVL